MKQSKIYIPSLVTQFAEYQSQTYYIRIGGSGNAVFTDSDRTIHDVDWCWCSDCSHYRFYRNQYAKENPIIP